MERAIQPIDNRQVRLDEYPEETRNPMAKFYVMQIYFVIFKLIFVFWFLGTVLEAKESYEMDMKTNTSD